MRLFLASLVALLLLSGCGNTWRGVKQDTKEAGQWTKEKVHDGAEWVGEKTE
ncbi:MAG: hypothetical protein ACK5LP_00905 [Campylobacteraceae bacterium]